MGHAPRFSGAAGASCPPRVEHAQAPEPPERPRDDRHDPPPGYRLTDRLPEPDPDDERLRRVTTGRTLALVDAHPLCRRVLEESGIMRVCR